MNLNLGRFTWARGNLGRFQGAYQGELQVSTCAGSSDQAPAAGLQCQNPRRTSFPLLLGYDLDPKQGITIDVYHLI